MFLISANYVPTKNAYNYLPIVAHFGSDISLSRLAKLKNFTILLFIPFYIYYINACYSPVPTPPKTVKPVYIYSHYLSYSLPKLSIYNY